MKFQAGAKKVIGVDCSDIIDQAKQIVKDNNLEHGDDSRWEWHCLLTFS